MLISLARRLRDYCEKRIVSAHLARMDDHELNDIGVARHDIDLVVRRGRLQI